MKDSEFFAALKESKLIIALGLAFVGNQGFQTYNSSSGVREVRELNETVKGMAVDAASIHQDMTRVATTQEAISKIVARHEDKIESQAEQIGSIRTSTQLNTAAIGEADRRMTRVVDAFSDLRKAQVSTQNDVSAIRGERASGRRGGT